MRISAPTFSLARSKSFIVGVHTIDDVAALRSLFQEVASDLNVNDYADDGWEDYARDQLSDACVPDDIIDRSVELCADRSFKPGPAADLQGRRFRVKREGVKCSASAIDVPVGTIGVLSSPSNFGRVVTRLDESSRCALLHWADIEILPA